jgi:Autophagy-related protein 11
MVREILVVVLPIRWTVSERLNERCLLELVSSPELIADLGLSVSFPHYFLQATGHLAEQLKTREWIVARITSITERVVDQKVR